MVRVFVALSLVVISLTSLAAPALARPSESTVLVHGRMLVPEADPPAAPILDARIGISEGWRDASRLAETQAGSDRYVFAWSQFEPNGPASFQPNVAVPPGRLEGVLQDGRELMGLIQFTPAWAARNPEQGERSVPRDLGDPNGPWYQFVKRLANYYRGKVSHWMIWNEMEFRPNDVGGGGSWTWDGTEEEYWLLLKDAAKAVNEVDPDAQIVFGSTSYWVDMVNGRELYAKRVLDVAVQDPEAYANDFFFDAIAMNIYRAPDDVMRIQAELREILESHGLDKPTWVTELNCMPFDDAFTPKDDDAQRCTLDEQAAYVIQAYAIALSTGWDRALWYQLTDNNIWNEQEVWGLVRDDGTDRPAFAAFRTVTQYFAHADRFTFAPLARSWLPWSAWPDNPDSFYPNYLVYQVVVDRGTERTNVLWNSSAQSLWVAVPRQGESAVLVDKLGNPYPLEATDGWYYVQLGPASASGPFDPSGYYYVGGDPWLIVQQGVPADTEVLALSLAS
jgi:hypothetical protein